MPVAGHLHTIQFGGKMAVTEGWSCSLHFLTAGAAFASLNPLKAAILAWWRDPNSLINGLATLNFVKANEIVPLTGKYLDTAGSNGVVFNDEAPANATTRVPPQLTIAHTLRTASQRGLASRGRYFPPTGISTVDVNGQLDSGQCAGLASVAKGLLDSINSLDGGRVVVFSKKGQSTMVVTSVAVGTVIDTQRRRRKSLKETYMAAVLS